MDRHFWLIKSEPEVYSIEDLEKDGRTSWEGVRNYQARNMLRDQMKKGDLAFFYHSNANPAGIAGIARVVKEGYPDPSAFDPRSEYYDPKSSPEKPAWFMVDVAFERKFERLIPLEGLRSIKGLEGMALLQKGQRLSVQPVSKKEWEVIAQLADEKIRS